MKSVKTISNTTWAQLKVGDTASIERGCSDRDLLLFAHMSGNTNPLMLPPTEGAPAVETPIAPSMWVGSLISAVLGNILPGPGTLYRAQNFEFVNRVHVGDRLRVTVTCREKREEPVAVFETVVVNAKGEPVCKGTAIVNAPTQHVEIAERELPALIMEEKEQFPHLLALASQLPRLKTVIVCPENHNSLGGPLLAAEHGLIEPIFIGDPERIAKAA
ncbi:MaoC/PaaZ C-terminal domain-containing protein, partial [Rhodoblastus sp.]|uniref:MaoC/PaaZ C-terminal domain-containing protein n=1 Tax=Rhodoblastus sp. TaxID=1962975 RepID=UPI0035B49501